MWRGFYRSDTAASKYHSANNKKGSSHLTDNRRPVGKGDSEIDEVDDAAAVGGARAVGGLCASDVTMSYGARTSRIVRIWSIMRHGVA